MYPRGAGSERSRFRDGDKCFYLPDVHVHTLHQDGLLEE
jgi:hypothetical protein